MSKPELYLVRDNGIGLRHFPAALRRMASGLCVVTAGHDEEISGVTVASLTPLSIDPPRLLVNLSQHASVCRLITRDRKLVYRIDDGIPVLLQDESISSAHVTDFPA